MKYILILGLAIFLNGCAIFGKPTELDETKGMSPERIYQAGSESMADKDYDKAIGYFGKLESRYPNGRYATQAQIETAYAHYKKGDAVAAVAAADRFIKLHPNHPNVDYAYYLKGLAVFNERGMIDKLTKQQISDRDPRALRDSFLTLKDLVTRYPNSRYAKDATQRMLYLSNSLSDHELDVARYYMKRQAYLAAVNRCKYIIEYYPHSPAIESALVTMVSAYDNLGLDDLKSDTLRILKTNYPENPMVTGKIKQEEKIWWKFWEAL